MQAERHTRILAYLENHEFLSIGEAVHRLRASRSTIWRDFMILSSHGLVEKTRGGIKKRPAGSVSVLPFNQRQIKFAEEKNAIARRAAQLLREEDVFIADGGTTTYHLAEHVPDIPLTFVTVSVPLLLAVSKRKHEFRALQMMVIGGLYDPDLGISVGSSVNDSIARVNAQWTFLGADGVSEDGIFNNNYLSVQSKVQMIRNSERVAVLADHSKIGRRAMTQVCGLDEIDLLITDESDGNGATLDRIRKNGVEVIVVSHEDPVVKGGEPDLVGDRSK